MAAAAAVAVAVIVVVVVVLVVVVIAVVTIVTAVEVHVHVVSIIQLNDLDVRALLGALVKCSFLQSLPHSGVTRGHLLQAVKIFSVDWRDNCF